jgi:CheY-like chemotaxis protein
MASVLLCTDEPILAEGLARIFTGVEGLELASSCRGLEGLRETLEGHQPDILLMDLTAGITFAALSGLHEVVSHAKIVLWVHSISTELALQAMSLGVRGILRKTLPTETLIRCLTRVMEGELADGQYYVGAPLLPHTSRGAIGESALTRLEKQGDSDCAEHLRGYGEGVPFAAVPEAGRKGPLRTGALRSQKSGAGRVARPAGRQASQQQRPGVAAAALVFRGTDAAEVAAVATGPARHGIALQVLIRISILRHWFLRAGRQSFVSPAFFISRNAEVLS